MMIATALALLAAGPTRAEAPETTEDLRCLAISFAVTSNKDPAISQAGILSALYYLGRLDGREPRFELEKRLSEPNVLPVGKALEELAQNCGSKLQTRGQELVEMGARISVIEQAREAKAAK
ncbi:MAG: hypothetical protein KKC14_04655 [Alphaproteobacteria bacterium]|nr:hypothetical protein [Alphaproteobacteria bacterium]